MEFVNRPRRLKPSVFASCPLAPQPPGGEVVWYFVDRTSEYSFLFQILDAKFDFAASRDWGAAIIAPPDDVYFQPTGWGAWPQVSPTPVEPYVFDQGVWYGANGGGYIEVVSYSLPEQQGEIFFSGGTINGIALPPFASFYIED